MMVPQGTRCIRRRRGCGWGCGCGCGRTIGVGAGVGVGVGVVAPWGIGGGRCLNARHGKAGCVALDRGEKAQRRRRRQAPAPAPAPALEGKQAGWSGVAVVPWAQISPPPTHRLAGNATGGSHSSTRLHRLQPHGFAHSVLSCLSHSLPLCLCLSLARPLASTFPFPFPPSPSPSLSASAPAPPLAPPPRCVPATAQSRGTAAHRSLSSRRRRRRHSL